MSLLTRALQPRLGPFARHASTARPTRTWTHRLPLRPLAAVGLLSAGGLALASSPTDSPADTDTPTAGPTPTPAGLARVPFGTLVRTYVVYTALSFPGVVDYAPSMLAFLTSIPGVKGLTLYCVRHTFFAQFVGGETAEDLLPVMRTLRAQNKASILTYNVEVDEAPGAEAHWRRNVQETKRSIEVMGRHKGADDGIVAIKLTALVPHATALESISQYLLAHRNASAVAYPGTPEQLDVAVLQAQPAAKALPEPPARDIAEVREMYEECRNIARMASERGIKLLIDAEHTWYQPVIDAITLALSQEFNASPRPRGWFSAPSSPPKAVVYGTYQSYLQRNPAHLRAQLALARAAHYALGVKLVRGAYHTQEVAYAQARGVPPPVWGEKAQTDACYDGLVQLLLADIAAAKGRSGTAVVFGTHNRASVECILEGLVAEGLAGREDGGKVRIRPEVEGRVAVAQLYGMHDNLTDYVAERLVARSPVATKCIPYGTLEEVMPYLGRRAIENKSVLGGQGGAAEERRRMGQELWRRVRGWVAL